MREQKPIIIGSSQPEPDLAVVKGPVRRYFRQHPRPEDISLIMEIADTSLLEDRSWKSQIYGGGKIPCFWIINLVDRCVEVMTQPGKGKKKGYEKVQIYSKADQIPLVIAGKEVAQLLVADFFPG